jgi:hypothetical protein
MKHDWRKTRRRRDFVVPNPREGGLFLENIFLNGGENSCEGRMIELLQNLLHKEARAWGKEGLIFKYPLLFARMRLLQEAFPHGFFVHIIRDGRAVALSLSRKRKEHRDGESRQAQLRRLAERWREAVTMVNDAGRGERNYLEMRYEEFCEDIHSHIASVLSFAGLDEEKMPWHRLPRRLTPTNHKWLKSCQEDERLLLEQVMGAELRSLGYAAGPEAEGRQV